MATVESGTSGRSPGNECENAREYVLERLEGVEEPVSPTVLSGEYGCTRSHMAEVMSELVDEGMLARVGRGEYLRSENVDEETYSDVWGRGNTSEETSEGTSEETDSDMASREEYEEQHDLESEGSEEGEEEYESGSTGTLATAAGTGAAAAGASAMDSEEGINWWVIVGVIVVGGLLWWLYSRSGSDTQGDGREESESEEEVSREEVSLFEEVQ